MSGGGLPCRNDEIVGHLNTASTTPVQEPCHMTSLHLVLARQLGRTAFQKLLQILPGGLQRIGIFHEQFIMEVSTQFQSVLHTAIE